MPKLGVFSGREICSILEKEGFYTARQRGSHRIVQKKTPTGTITVPVPDHPSVRIGTLASIIRQSGVSRDLFMK